MDRSRKSKTAKEILEVLEQQLANAQHALAASAKTYANAVGRRGEKNALLDLEIAARTFSHAHDEHTQTAFVTPRGGK